MNLTALYVVPCSSETESVFRIRTGLIKAGRQRSLTLPLTNTLTRPLAMTVADLLSSAGVSLSAALDIAKLPNRKLDSNQISHPYDPIPDMATPDENSGGIKPQSYLQAQPYMVNTDTLAPPVDTVGGRFSSSSELDEFGGMVSLTEGGTTTDTTTENETPPESPSGGTGVGLMVLVNPPEADGLEKDPSSPNSMKIPAPTPMPKWKMDMVPASHPHPQPHTPHTQSISPSTNEHQALLPTFSSSMGVNHHSIVKSSSSGEELELEHTQNTEKELEAMKTIRVSTLQRAPNGSPQILTPKSTPTSTLTSAHPAFSATGTKDPEVKANRPVQLSQLRSESLRVVVEDRKRRSTLDQLREQWEAVKKAEEEVLNVKNNANGIVCASTLPGNIMIINAGVGGNEDSDDEEDDRFMTIKASTFRTNAHPPALVSDQARIQSRVHRANRPPRLDLSGVSALSAGSPSARTKARGAPEYVHTTSVTGVGSNAEDERAKHGEMSMATKNVREKEKEPTFSPGSPRSELNFLPMPLIPVPVDVEPLSTTSHDPNDPVDSGLREKYRSRCPFSPDSPSPSFTTSFPRSTDPMGAPSNTYSPPTAPIIEGEDAGDTISQFQTLVPSSSLIDLKSPRLRPIRLDSDSEGSPSPLDLSDGEKDDGGESEGEVKGVRDLNVDKGKNITSVGKGCEGRRPGHTRSSSLTVSDILFKRPGSKIIAAATSIPNPPYPPPPSRTFSYSSLPSTSPRSSEAEEENRLLGSASSASASVSGSDSGSPASVISPTSRIIASKSGLIRGHRRVRSSFYPFTTKPSSMDKEASGSWSFET